MTEFTENLNLTLPDFDIVTWHDQVNDNFVILDSVVATTGLTGFLGIWQNSFNYVAGNRVVDNELGSSWQCQLDHLSPATGTFADDRAANPDRWGSVSAIPAIRGEWANDTPYFIGETAYASAESLYGICNDSHTSSSAPATMRDDIAVWDVIADLKADVDAAAASAAAAEAAFLAFDQRYLGSHASDPALDNQGNPLMVGAMYWNNVVSEIRVWESTFWQSITVGAATVGVQEFVTTAGQTVFAVTEFTVISGNEFVHQNGIRLSASVDYTVDEAQQQVILNIGASLNDRLIVQGIGTFQVGSAVVAGQPYEYHTDTDTTTVQDGHIKFDVDLSVEPENVTTMGVSYFNSSEPAGSNDISNWLKTFDDTPGTDRGTIHVKDSDDPASIFIVRVTGDIVDDPTNNELEIPIERVSYSGAYVNGQQITIEFYARGADGSIGLTWKNNWQAATQYEISDAVHNNSRAYITTVVNTDVEPGVTAGWETSWDILADSVVFRGAWSGATSYQLNDLVEHDGSCFINLINGNLGNMPPVYTTGGDANWDLFARQGVDGAGAIVTARNVGTGVDLFDGLSSTNTVIDIRTVQALASGLLQVVENADTDTVDVGLAQSVVSRIIGRPTTGGTGLPIHLTPDQVMAILDAAIDAVARQSDIIDYINLINVWAKAQRGTISSVARVAGSPDTYTPDLWLSNHFYLNGGGTNSAVNGAASLLNPPANTTSALVSGQDQEGIIRGITDGVGTLGLASGWKEAAPIDVGINTEFAVYYEGYWNFNIATPAIEFRAIGVDTWAAS